MPLSGSCPIYQRLTPTQGSIRLLQISSSEALASPQGGECANEQRLSCYLTNTSLDSPTPFTALSYAWETSMRKERILVNDNPLDVGENLAAALRYFRDSQQAETSALWIDALCINQDDDAEKTDQVLQMSEIYARAETVVVWVGAARDGSDEAIRWLQHFGGESGRFKIGSEPRLRLRNLFTQLDRGGSEEMDNDLASFLKELSLSLLTPREESPIPALAKLLERKYWNRVWVVQELAMGKNIQLVCGNVALSEDFADRGFRLLRNFRQYMLLKKNCEQINVDLGPLLALNPAAAIRLLKTGKQSVEVPLIHLLRSHRSFASSNPEDKVYALLGLASDTKALGITPDYGISCRQIYIDVAAKLIMNGYTEVFSLCDSKDLSPSLPSWVPDWSREPPYMPIKQRGLDRSTKPPASVWQPSFCAGGVWSLPVEGYETVADHSHLMSVPAILLGVVEETGLPWKPEEVGRWVRSIHQFASASIDSSGDDPKCFEAVWRVAAADQTILRGWEKPRLSEDFIYKLQTLSKSGNLSQLSAGSFSKDDLGDVYQGIKSMARGRRPIRGSQQLFGIGPSSAAIGDMMYIFKGGDVPYVLRRDSESGHMRLIGEAFIYGIMDGEALRHGANWHSVVLI